MNIIYLTSLNELQLIHSNRKALVS